MTKLETRLTVINLKYSAVVVCVVATTAAIQEVLSVTP